MTHLGLPNNLPPHLLRRRQLLDRRIHRLSSLPDDQAREREWKQLELLYAALAADASALAA